MKSNRNKLNIPTLEFSESYVVVIEKKIGTAKLVPVNNNRQWKVHKNFFYA